MINERGLSKEDQHIHFIKFHLITKIKKKKRKKKRVVGGEV